MFVRCNRHQPLQQRPESRVLAIGKRPFLRGIRAAYLSARNDVLANIAIIGAGLLTYTTHSIWPDIVVGIGIAALNLDAAREVWEAARSEKKAIAEPVP